MQLLNHVKLVKGISLWRLSGLRGLTFEELDSTLNQVLDTPGCPPEVFISDVNERYSAGDLQNKHARLLLWQKL